MQTDFKTHKKLKVIKFLQDKVGIDKVGYLNFQLHNNTQIAEICNSYLNKEQTKTALIFTTILVFVLRFPYCSQVYPSPSYLKCTLVLSQHGISPTHREWVVFVNELFILTCTSDVGINAIPGQITSASKPFLDIAVIQSSRLRPYS